MRRGDLVDLLGLALIWGASFLFWGLARPHSPARRWWVGQPVLSLLGLGVLGTGIAYLLFFRLIRHVGPTRASMVTYLLPCTALIYGVILLHEPATANDLETS